MDMECLWSSGVDKELVRSNYKTMLYIGEDMMYLDKVGSILFKDDSIDANAAKDLIGRVLGQS
jgi:hypothetical protein